MQYIDHNLQMVCDTINLAGFYVDGVDRFGGYALVGTRIRVSYTEACGFIIEQLDWLATERTGAEVWVDATPERWRPIFSVADLHVSLSRVRDNVEAGRAQELRGSAVRRSGQVVNLDDYRRQREGQ